MEKTNTIANLAECLTQNNRYASRKITAEQISAESFDAWNGLISKLHRASYSVYVLCENSGLKAESDSVNKSAIFDTLREILALIGDVNEHKLYANAEAAIAMIGYSGRRGNVDAPELQFCTSRLANARKELKAYTAINVTDAEYKATKIAEMEKNIATLEDEKSKLLDTADMRHKMPTRTNYNAFRLEVEHFLARAINGQLSKTLEELDAEDNARKERRKAAAKARKANKAN